MRAQTQTVSNGATRDQVEEWIMDNIRECAEHAAKYGVIIGVQNHGDFLKTADDQISLINRVKSPWWGGIVDFGYYKATDSVRRRWPRPRRMRALGVKQSPEGV